MILAVEIHDEYNKCETFNVKILYTFNYIASNTVWNSMKTQYTYTVVKIEILIFGIQRA